MDNLTHSLVGALIGQAGLKRRTGLAMPALIVGANLPDIDATCTIYGLESLAMRRGLTHGPIAWLVLPLVLAGALWAFDRWQASRGKRPEGRAPVRFGWLYGLSLVACLTHPALDWLNTYGIRFLEPFSSRWFYGDVLFIIDVWLWLGLGFAIWSSLRRERRGGDWKRPARAALALALAYIGLNAAISAYDRANHGTRLAAGAEFISSPVPVAFWQRQQIIGRDEDSWRTSNSSFPGGPVEQRSDFPARARRCIWPDTDRLRRANPALDAFLFWSRAPFAERASDGDYVVIRDARFAGFGREGFAVVLRNVPCRTPRDA